MKTVLLSSLLLLMHLNFGAQVLGAEKMDPKVWGGIKISVLDHGLASPPKVITTVNPVFPNVQGQAHYLVTLEFIVDKNGKVQALHEVGIQEQAFVEAAQAAVSQWKFEPGVKAGAIVDAHMRVTIPFKTVTRDNSPGRFSP